MQHDLVIYLDENHCENKKVLDALRAAKVSVQRHLEHFSPGTPDIEWLPFVGDRGWAVITTDKAIRKRVLERMAVEQNKVSLFCFTSNQISGQQMAAALENALPRIRRLMERQPPPFIATISPSGVVELYNTFQHEKVNLR